MNRRRRNLAYLFGPSLVLLLLILTSCGGAAAQGASPTATLPSSGGPTLTPATRPPKPMRTASPTITPPVPTQSATATPAPTATPPALATIVAAEEPKAIQSERSPDDRWRVDVVSYPCVETLESSAQRAEQLKLVDIEQDTEVVIQTQMLVCEDALGAFGLGGLFWSPDSRSFYYTDAREGVPDGGSACWDRPLWVLHAGDATTERLARIWARADDGWIARWQDGDLILQDTNGEDVRRTPLHFPQAEVCRILWSSDDSAVVYLQAMQPFEPGKVALIRVDRADAVSTVLFELEGAAFVTADWTTSGQIRLSGLPSGTLQEWNVDTH